MGHWRYQRPKENPVKLLKWSSGKIEAFAGSMEKAWEYAKSQEEKTGDHCLEII